MRSEFISFFRGDTGSPSFGRRPAKELKNLFFLFCLFISSRQFSSVPCQFKKFERSELSLISVFLFFFFHTGGLSSYDQGMFV